MKEMDQNSRSRAVMLAFSVLASSMVHAGPGGTSRETADTVLGVARRSLPGFLEQIPVGQETRYGFDHRGQFPAARLGDPIPVLALRPSVGDSQAQASDPRWDRPEATGVWRVPVEIGGEVRTLLTVERLGESFLAVEIGGASLGRELAELDTLHPRLRKGLLRLEALRGDILLLDSAQGDFSKASCRPLRSFRQAMPKDSDGTRSHLEMFRSLHRELHRRAIDPASPPKAPEVSR